MEASSGTWSTQCSQRKILWPRGFRVWQLERSYPTMVSLSKDGGQRWVELLRCSRNIQSLKFHLNVVLLGEEV